MSNTDPKMKKRILILAVPVLILCAIIWGKLIYISTVEGKVLRERSEKLTIQVREIAAKRGDIYSADGKLLATSALIYNVSMDPVSPNQSDFDANITALSAELSKMFLSRNARQWENYIKTNRSNGDRFIHIEAGLSYSQLQRLKKFPLFNLGSYKGGLIVQQESQRQQPLATASRTVGYDIESAQAGIEGYFSSYLEGHPGKRLSQKIGGGNWKPIYDASSVEPEDGQDIYTTINTRIQDAAQRALMASLVKYEADHGSVVVMEVSTGRIVAIANLGIDENGEYTEQRNYAVWETTEPGSTFKLASLMIALEDGKVDTADIVDTENGIYTIYGKKVKDSNVKYGKGGYGKISVAQAFRLSSNTGIVKAVYGAYEKDPQAFVDEIYNLGLQRKTGIKIKGESAPIIPTPKDKNWSGITLPWMTFGYSLSLTPLQMLTFYNAIANNGVMVKPQIVTTISQHGHNEETFEPEILNPSICSKETIKQLRALLEGVVKSGTATNLYSSKLPLAGKTGTSQVNYWKSSSEYQASFAGYFPANDPKYSCIVVINRPNYNIGYYGSHVAGPVFKAIAEEVYLSMPELLEPTKGISAWQIAGTEQREKALTQNYLPSLTGLTAMQAVSLLENHGFNVKVNGSGKVRAQSPSIGSALRKNMTIELTLR